MHSNKVHLKLYIYETKWQINTGVI